MKAALAIAGIGLFLAGATSAQALSPAQEHGRALYNETCVYCHDAKGHATKLIKKRLGGREAVLDARTDLNAAYIKYAVRHGVQSMPWFRRAELSDADLSDVTAYLTRANPPAKP